jgi:hypothetical protein
MRLNRTGVRFHAVVSFEAELSQDKSAHFYRYNCSYASDGHNK